MVNLVEFQQHKNYSECVVKWLETRWRAKDAALKFLNVAGGTLNELNEVCEKFMIDVSNSVRKECA